MSVISSLGVGSGIDLNNLVDELVTAERRPAERRLDRDQERLEVQLSAFGSVRGALDNLQTASTALAETREGRQATSSIETLGVSASADADAGRYNVAVNSLAAAQSMASDAFADADAPVGAGTLTLALGDDTAVTLEFGENATLRDVRDAINASGAEVQASMVNDATGSRLLLSGQRTGSGETLTLTAGGGLDARLDHAQMTETVGATDAEVVIDGLSVTSASNRLENVLPGVTLDLTAPTPAGEPARVEVGLDRDALKARVAGFVEAYNAVAGKIGGLTAFDPESQQGGPLQGDATLRGITSTLRGVLGNPAVAEGNTRFMVNLGVRTGDDGTLSFDESAFDQALDDDVDAVLGVLNGFGDQLRERVRGFAAGDGLLAGRSDSIRGRLRQLALQRETLEARMERFEARTRRQFSAMDAIVAELRSTSEFLDQQLAGLQNNNRR